MHTNLMRGILVCTYLPSVCTDQIRLDQSLSHVRLFATPWIPACRASLSITNSRSSLKLMSIKSVMPSSHLILSSPSPPAPNPSQHQGFSNESTLRTRWPKYWSFSFSISPSNEYSQLISFRIDWFDLVAIQGTFQHLFQHHSSKASIFWCSAFFMVQLSHSWPLEKTIALTRWTLLAKWCLCFLICCLGLSLLFFQRTSSF